ncbi:MAG TPA: S-layer homology domain-containing protein [Candidatus Baltobacteraceae bacterium]|nr:S-layer homology domain-containing protein [Candidatus Baltobacteraceae bacterium]
MHLPSKILLFALIGLFVVACAKTAQTSSQSAASPAASPTSTTSAMAAASPVATASGPVATAAASPAASGSAAVTVAYTDINGIVAEKAIQNEAALGVFESTTGAFNPNAQISRGEFVKWLVILNNDYYKDNLSNQLRLPETAEATFDDVPQTSPYWKYVQALTDAGFTVGVDAKHFAPDRAINRQEMIAIKSQVDAGHKFTPNPEDTTKTLTDHGFVDGNQVNKNYVTVMLADIYDGGGGNFERVWGKTVYLHPAQPVTRAEAALTLSEIAGTSVPQAQPH